MQSILGALLTAGYAAAAGAAIASAGAHVTSNTQAALTKSFSSAADLAQRYPPSIQNEIINGAKSSFLAGDRWAYLAGIAAVLAGAVLVAFFFPKKEREQQLVASYQAQDAETETPETPGQSAPLPT
jgi:MFS transporter, DHA2 family, multidrug resistance protein